MNWLTDFFLRSICNLKSYKILIKIHTLSIYTWMMCMSSLLIMNILQSNRKVSFKNTVNKLLVLYLYTTVSSFIDGNKKCTDFPRNRYIFWYFVIAFCMTNFLLRLIVRMLCWFRSFFLISLQSPWTFNFVSR